ncbi:hypothetical protein [Massilia sp. TSP1-1-2]|uniref:hypothetical protein n=1 Tax=unclassified Massilia TaxID=2609279 RepID=UPI003CE8AE84
MIRKIFVVSAVLAAGAVSLAAARVFIAPAMGAATVAQLDASDSAYHLSMFLLYLSSLAPLVITCLFALALHLMLRSKK